MSVVIIVLIMSGLFAYAGNWPPLVVVESDSMQHSSTRSSIGTIDTGDLVVVKRVDYEEVETYLERVLNGHETYGQAGDVVIYKRYGDPQLTSIIHRAICKVDYNSTGGGFDIPVLRDLPEEMWSTPQDRWWNLDGVVTLHDVGYREVEVHLDLSAMLSYFEDQGREPHGGLITMGDHNFVLREGTMTGLYDQQTNICREPVKGDWVTGLARGELPWFGLLKLWISGDSPQNVPSNSVTNLFVSLGLIIGVPVAIDLSTLVLKRRGWEPPSLERFHPRRLWERLRKK
ncbi:MAG: S26 family signal peptidase [Methanomassiliicoccales archaeon]